MCWITICRNIWEKRNFQQTHRISNKEITRRKHAHKLYILFCKEWLRFHIIMNGTHTSVDFVLFFLGGRIDVGGDDDFCSCCCCCWGCCCGFTCLDKLGEVTVDDVDVDGVGDDVVWITICPVADDKELFVCLPGNLGVLLGGGGTIFLGLVLFLLIELDGDLLTVFFFFLSFLVLELFLFVFIFVLIWFINDISSITLSVLSKSWSVIFKLPETASCCELAYVEIILDIELDRDLKFTWKKKKYCQWYFSIHINAFL